MIELITNSLKLFYHIVELICFKATEKPIPQFGCFQPETFHFVNHDHHLSLEWQLNVSSHKTDQKHKTIIYVYVSSIKRDFRMFTQCSHHRNQKEKTCIAKLQSHIRGDVVVDDSDG